MNENYLVLDCETESIEKGHPFHPDNFLCTVHWRSSTDVYGCFLIEYETLEPYGPKLDELQEMIDAHDVLVLFNAKFDLHWLRRYGIRFQHKRIVDVQYLYFMLTYQQNKYPSLNDVCSYLGLETKQDVVYEEYWSKGILTSQIPPDVLIPYGNHDVFLTWESAKKLLAKLETRDAAFRNTFAVAMVDTLILEEMEWHGLRYDTIAAAQVKEDTEAEIAEVDDLISEFTGGVPINTGSNDQLSALIYGGKIYEKYYEQDGVYKSGARVGLPKMVPRVREHVMPGFVRPKQEWATSKEGVYSVGADTLEIISQTRKGRAKKLVDLVLRKAGLMKRLSAYCNSIETLIHDKGWTSERGIATLHGNLNQCVAVTGRLSSASPNLQNIDGNIKFLFVSEFSKRNEYEQHEQQVSDSQIQGA